MQKMIVLLSVLFFSTIQLFSGDYSVLDFGAKNDGISLNTRIIQGAIDYISENGGGRLIFDPGVYISGTFYLKSDVTLYLREGAEIRGSGNPFDHTDKYFEWTALILAVEQENIGIEGEGIINAMGFENANNLVDLIHKGIVNDGLSYDRPDANRTSVLCVGGCRDVKITGVTLKDPSGWTLVLNQSKGVFIDRIHIDGKAYWNNDGIDIVDSEDVIIKNSFIDASDDGICFKSHDAEKICQNVVVDSCVVRSSASGLKFGTVNRGGFRNIKVTNLKVYDTFRSAVTIQAVDGGIAEDILIDGVEALNVGNPIFIRMGDRWSYGKKPRISGITIKNMYAEVAASKPDAGYRYEGPVEDLPRNISPSGIIGMPEWKVENIELSNIEIVYPGGANPNYAMRGVTGEELEEIPEMPYKYPEFSQFKELPAWGFYVRHAENIIFRSVKLSVLEEDYRVPFVFDDTQGVEMEEVHITEPGGNEKEKFIFHNSTYRTK